MNGSINLLPHTISCAVIYIAIIIYRISNGHVIIVGRKVAAAVHHKSAVELQRDIKVKPADNCGGINPGAEITQVV